MKNMIMIFAGALIIGILGGISGALLSPGRHEEKVEKKEVSHKEEKEEVVKKEAIYFEVTPPFVASIGDADGTHFLQVDVVLMSYEKDSIRAIEHHLPLIRNDLSFLFSSQNFLDVSTPEGKIKLRGKALNAVRSIMENNFGKPAVEDLLFTKVVVQ